MKNKSLYAIIGIVIVVISILFYRSRDQITQHSLEYNPAVTPDNFTSTVDNKYFTLTPGTKFSYENKTGDGLERIEVVVTNEIKEVMGVATTVVWDRVWLDDQLIEDTKDWYAQDKDSNVWYFGEVVDNYENGKLKNHIGSWEAGVKGAKPGIVMQGNPTVGDSYRQEYYKDEAEDMGDIIVLDKKVTVPYGTFNNCLQTRDWSLLDNTLNEYKYYCQDAGFLVLEEAVGGQEKVELVNISSE